MAQLYFEVNYRDLRTFHFNASNSEEFCAKALPHFAKAGTIEDGTTIEVFFSVEVDFFGLPYFEQFWKVENGYNGEALDGEAFIAWKRAVALVGGASKNLRGPHGKPICSICRRRHGSEVQHACE